MLGGGLMWLRGSAALVGTEENRAHVVELWSSLDGLPLALELAASRMGSMTPAEIITTLGSRVQILGGVSSDDSRHKTLDATIGWSYELLTEESRGLLRGLGVMSGWFLLEDVLSGCGFDSVSADEVRERLSTLVEQSLVMADTSGLRTRYRLLETIRRFALARLGDDEPDTRRRHAWHFAALAELEAARLLTREEGDAAAELSAAYDNLRSAVGWAMETGHIETASRIVASAPDWAYWRSRNELAGWAQWVWENTTPADPRWRAVCGSAARGAWVEGRFDEAIQFGSAASGAANTVSARSGHPDDVIADVALYRGDAQAALDHYSRVVAEASESGDITREIWATYYVAVIHAVLRHPDEAAALATTALARGRATAMLLAEERDGWLDLVVANCAIWAPETDLWCSVDGKTKAYCPPARFRGLASSFYRNNGDGTFTEQTAVAGLGDERGKSLGIAEMDFNRDGWPDFVVANDGEPDQFYENNGDGTFTEKGMLTGMAYGERGEARAGMGIDLGMVDSSGQPSIFIGNFSQEMIGVYRYNQNGWFQDRAAVSRIGRASLLKLTFGVFLFDVDFDGDLDLFAANGHVYPVRTKTLDGITYRQPAQLFLNAGDGTFEEAGQYAGSVFQMPMVARGAAYADFDHDGDLDVLITENGGPVHLWRNELEDGHYLRVRLEGVQSNRDGIGSNIIAVIGKQRMERRIRTASSYLSQMEKVATFGLGAATVVDSLLISWPSGKIERLVQVAANQEIRIVEDSGIRAQQPVVNP